MAQSAVKPVTERRKQIAAEYGLRNVEHIAEQCRAVGIPFYAACALMEQESMGRHVYGHDKGGALAGFPLEVNRGNFDVFGWLVFSKGQTSNGVGPSQITYAGERRTDGTRDGGYFKQMEAEGLRPWVVEDNIFFGLRLLWRHYLNNNEDWVLAGQRYNGARQYGLDLAAKIAAWHERLGI